MPKTAQKPATSAANQPITSTSIKPEPLASVTQDSASEPLKRQPLVESPLLKATRDFDARQLHEMTYYLDARVQELRRVAAVKYPDYQPDNVKLNHPMDRALITSERLFAHLYPESTALGRAAVAMLNLDVGRTSLDDEESTAKERISKVITPLLDLHIMIEDRLKSGEEPNFSLLGILQREIGLAIVRLDPGVMGVADI